MILQAWYAKTPLGKAWSAALAAKEAEKEKGKKGKAPLSILSLGKQIQLNTGCFPSFESAAMLAELATCWVAWRTPGSVGSCFLGTTNSTTQQRGY